MESAQPKADEMTFNINDPVTILHGGLDDFPGVDMAGVPGRICTTYDNAMPGMVSVWVDWSRTPYAEHADSLPRVFNTWPNHLAPAEPEEPRKPRHPFKLAPINLDALKSDDEPEDNPEDNPRPGLRLV